MIKPFKFLQTNRKIFPYEMTGKISWTPLLLMNSETWNTPRSNLIKEWLSDFFYGYHPHGFNKEKYFPEFDRTCEIIQSGLDTYRHQRVFTSTVRIYRRIDEYMELELKYPI